MTDEMDPVQLAALELMDGADAWNGVLKFAGYVYIDQQGGTASWLSSDHVFEILPGRAHGRVKSSANLTDQPNAELKCSQVFASLNYEDNMGAAANDLLNAAFGREAGPAARSLPDQLLATIRQLLAPPDELGTSVTAPTVEDATLCSGTLRLRRASEIPLVPVSWLWQDMIPAGHLTLLAGREGVGKSTLAYTVAAEVTRGWLLGSQEGKPAPVIIVASEDSWSSTIAPRLVAARANMKMVFALELKGGGGAYGVDLPKHVPDLKLLLEDRPGALVLLYPLISRLNGRLDTHKDAEVRRALEPLIRCLDETGATAVGLIHVNKTATTDPLTTVMASRAFVGVARSVLFVAVDPNEPDVRYLQLVKSNLGSTSIPTMTFSISSKTLDGEGHRPVEVGKLDWLEDSPRTVREILGSECGRASGHTQVQQARSWLRSFMAEHGGRHESTAIKAAANAEGISTSALHRARQDLGIVDEATATYPRTTVWCTPDA